MNVSRALVRQFTTSSARNANEIHQGYCKIKPLQEKFQKPDGKPVFLKGGGGDQFLYRLTMGLTLLGIGGMGHLFFTLIFPPKQE